MNGSASSPAKSGGANEATRRRRTSLSVVRRSARSPEPDGSAGTALHERCGVAQPGDRRRVVAGQVDRRVLPRVVEDASHGGLGDVVLGADAVDLEVLELGLVVGGVAADQDVVVGLDDED